MLYAQRRDTRIFFFFFTFDSALVSAIYNGQEDINAVANFFFFGERERLLERMASILGRSDDNFGNFSCDTLEGRDFEKICSHVEKSNSNFCELQRGM